MGNPILGIAGMGNPLLGMASHDLSDAKATILGATPGAILGFDGNLHEIFSFAPALSERFFKKWGGPPHARSFLECLRVCFSKCWSSSESQKVALDSRVPLAVPCACMYPNIVTGFRRDGHTHSTSMIFEAARERFSGKPKLSENAPFHLRRSN